MSHIYSFEKLEAWKDSRHLVKSIYLLTKSFPDEEKYGLVSQMRRCAISIASNLAEGTSRKTIKDKAHFTTISCSSSLELLNQLIISQDLGFLSKDEYIQIRLEIEKVTNKLNSLRNTQLRNSQ